MGQLAAIRLEASNQYTQINDLYNQIECLMEEAQFQDSYSNIQKETKEIMATLEYEFSELTMKHEGEIGKQAPNDSSGSRGGADGGGAGKGYKLELAAKPDKLMSESKPLEFRQWKEGWKVFFDLSQLQKAPLTTQVEILKMCLLDEMANRVKMYAATSIEVDMAMIEADCMASHPLINSRLEFKRLNKQHIRSSLISAQT